MAQVSRRLVGLVKTMAIWFRSENRGIVMAWWSTNYVLGGFLATAFATWAVVQSWLLPQLGWRRGFLFPALVLLPITVLFMTARRIRQSVMIPIRNAVRRGGATAPVRTDWSGVAALLRKPSLWMLSTSYFSWSFADTL